MCQDFVKMYLNYLEILSQIDQIQNCMEDYLSIYGYNELSENLSRFLIIIIYIMIE